MRTAHSSSHHRGEGCVSGPDPPQLPPWVWSWTRSPSTSPLGVGLDQIPLNFPLGCGPGPDPPQLPPWVWAWTKSPSTSPLGVGLDQIPLNFPLGVGLETPPGQIPLNFPLGCGLGNLQGMLGPDPSPGPGTPPGPATPPPTVDRMTFAGGHKLRSKRLSTRNEIQPVTDIQTDIILY